MKMKRETKTETESAQSQPHHLLPAQLQARLMSCPPAMASPQMIAKALVETAM
jgi:hypothetical protein